VSHLAARAAMYLSVVAALAALVYYEDIMNKVLKWLLIGLGCIAFIFVFGYAGLIFLLSRGGAG
jgi:hypothetical protein